MTGGLDLNSDLKQAAYVYTLKKEANISFEKCVNICQNYASSHFSTVAVDEECVEAVGHCLITAAKELDLLLALHKLFVSKCFSVGPTL